MLRATTKDKPDRTLWQTPQWFYDRLNRVFQFTMDGAALPENAKHNRFCMPPKEWAAIEGWTRVGGRPEYKHNRMGGLVAYCDFLSHLWENEVIFLNPPFGKGIDVFLKHVASCTFYNTTSVVLVPDDISTNWYHEWVKPYADVKPLEGRLAYEGMPGKSPNFGTLVAVYWGADMWRGKK